MAAPFHVILSKSDRALVAFIIAQGAGTEDNTFPTRRALEKQLPVIICFCESAVPDPGNPGTSIVKANIIVKTSAVLEPTEANPDKPRVDGESIAAPVFDCFYSFS